MAIDASSSYQFISKVLYIEGGKSDPMKILFTQDASASAYQMILFLLEAEMAKQTNLVPSPPFGRNQKINDIYTFLEELQVYLDTKLNWIEGLELTTRS